MTREELEVELKQFKDKYYFNGRVVPTDTLIVGTMCINFDARYIHNRTKVWDITSTEPFTIYARDFFTDYIKIYLINSTKNLTIVV